MKNHLIAAFLFAIIFGGMLLAVGCQPAGVTQGTIEVDDSRSAGCEMSVNIDGNQAMSITAGQGLVPFPNTVSPGNHTLNFITSGTCVGVTCLFQNDTANYPLTFSVGGGDVFEASVAEGTGGVCNDIIVSAVE